MEKWTRNIFVTGTGTDVGKTGLSLALLCHFLEENVCYYKPVQCGGDVKDMHNPADYSIMNAWLPQLKGKIFNSYHFKNPVSPHLAAEMEGVQIQGAKIKEDYLHLCEKFSLVIVEGAGGAFVPYNRKGDNLTQLLLDSSLQFVLACSPQLGTLNHSLLSISWLKSLGAQLGGFVTCQLEAELPGIFRDNIKTIEQLGEIKYLGHVPYIPDLALGHSMDGESQKKLAAGLLLGSLK